MHARRTLWLCLLCLVCNIIVKNSISFYEDKVVERLRFGDVVVDRLVESEGLSFYPAYLLPDAEDKAVAKEKDWLAPCFIDLESGRLIMSVHTYVIQTSRHVILVGTCMGNDTNRASTPQWHQQKTSWLAQLKSMGIARQQVDLVLVLISMSIMLVRIHS